MGQLPRRDPWLRFIRPKRQPVTAAAPCVPSFEASKQRLRRNFPCTNRSMFEAINDQLDWLYGEMDLLLPSLYGMGAFAPAAIVCCCLLRCSKELLLDRLGVRQARRPVRSLRHLPAQRLWPPAHPWLRPLHQAPRQHIHPTGQRFQSALGLETCARLEVSFDSKLTRALAAAAGGEGVGSDQEGAGGEGARGQGAALLHLASRVRRE